MTTVAVARSVAVRATAVAAAALVLGAVRLHRPDGMRTVCVLRAATGIPCPACGGTTAYVRLGRGNVLGALAANPFAILAGVALVLAPFGVLRRLRVAPAPLILGVLAVAEVWQLVRFGLL